MKEKVGRNLSILYIRYALEKTTLIVLILSIVFLSAILTLIANPYIEDSIYLLSFKDIHFNYLKQGLFVIGIFNSLIIALLAQSFSITSISFDSLFISYTKRNKICLSKMMAGFIILLFLNIVEGLIYLTIPTLIYERFKLEYELLYIIGYLLISGIIEMLLSIFLTTMVRSFIVPLSIAFISVSLHIVVEGIEDIYNYISLILPMITFKDYKITLDGLIMAPLWIITLSIFYIGAYEGKDLKESL